MTVSSEVSSSGPYTGNGVTTTFGYGFKIDNQTHIQVIKTDAAGVETTIAIDTDYSVTGVGNDGGGNVVLLVALPTGQFLNVRRNVPFTQEITLENQGAYFAKTVERALDLSVMRDQELEEKVGRSLKVDFGQETPRVPLSEPGKFLGWGDDGRLINASAGEIINAAGFATAAQGEKADTALQSGDDGLPISVFSFGALLNGAANDSAAIQLSLDTLGYAYIPYTPTGFIAGGITLRTGQRIYSNRKTVWKVAPPYAYGIRVLSFMSLEGTVLNQYTTVENFVFDLLSSPTTTTAFRMGTSTQTVFGLRVLNVDGKNCGSFYDEEIHSTNFVVDVEFKDVNLTQTRGRQIYSRRSRGQFLFEAVRIDHTQNTAQVTWEGARFEDLIGLELTRFDVVGPVIPTSTYQATAIGLVLQGTTPSGGQASVWLKRVLVDNTRGPGIKIVDVFNIQAVNVECYQNLGPGLDLTRVTKSQFTNTVVHGAKSDAGTLPGAAAGAHGIALTSCAHVQFANADSSRNTGAGYLLNNSQYIKITNVTGNENDGYGFLELGTSNRNVVVNATYLTNGAQLGQVGAQTAHVAWIGNAGSFNANTVGVINIP